jgi:1-acyl-sn-glycerol-3-phosphate acyltransferase
MYWVLKWLLLGPLVRVVARPVVSGSLPRRGPLIMAANHLAEIDSLVLGVTLGRRLTFVAKSEYFGQPGLRGRLYGLLCRATGQIPVDRSGGGRGDAALEAARRVLDAGRVWAIYPEGTRSPDGGLYRGRTGVARVALSRPKVPVVPVGIEGTAAIDNPRRRAWRPGRVRVVIGKPVDLSRWTGRAGDATARREATDEIMREIQALTSQRYAGRYPTREEIARRDAREEAGFE